MNPSRPLLFAALAIAAAAIADPTPAEACGVLTPDETTPVTGHQMILSLSNDGTTLWDRFQYTGDPAEFAWILPTQGIVEVGLSSDALFDALGQVTAAQIIAPDLGCPNTCNGQGGGGGGDGGGVEVIAHEVVGPYETVQLSSQDPNALKDWLTLNGFPIPAGIAPVLDTYVAEGFNFLAMRLVPGAGLDATRPVRITMPAAAPSVPIRLLAAGTGDITQVTLWVFSEGRWAPTNAPEVTVTSDELVWDFETGSSNYGQVKTDKLAATGGFGWLTERAAPFDTYSLSFPLQDLVTFAPDESGYGGDGVTPEDALAADLDALFGTLADPWAMRFAADLSRDALATDLQLGASADQTAMDGIYYLSNGVNEPPCPPDPCAGEGGGGGGTGGAGAGGTGAGGGTGGNGAEPAGGGGDCGCRLAGQDGAPAGLALLGAVAALALARRRRR